MKDKKYSIGDKVVVVKATSTANIGRVGMVIDIDEKGYALDVLPGYRYPEHFLAKATGTDLIREERRRQIEEEGYDANHDFREPLNCIVAAAVSYAMCDIDMKEAEAWWQWDFKYWKPKDRRRNLVRAGALIAAALDKMQDEEEFEEYKRNNK